MPIEDTGHPDRLIGNTGVQIFIGGHLGVYVGIREYRVADI